MKTQEFRIYISVGESKIMGDALADRQLEASAMMTATEIETIRNRIGQYISQCHNRRQKEAGDQRAAVTSCSP